MSNEKVEFAKLVDASVTMGANLTLAMGKKKLAAAVVKLSGLCFISEIIERHLLVCCRQDLVAPPGNFGGGSTGPHQLVQGIKGAQPGAPERPAARRPAAPHPGKDQRATGQSQSRAFLHSFSYSSQQQESL